MDELEDILNSETAFAVYREPGERFSHVVVQRDGVAMVISDMSSMAAHKGFVMLPFSLCDCPIRMVRADEEHFVELPSDGVFHGDISPLGDGEDNYRHTFPLFMEALQRGDFEKLVLSRCESFEMKYPNLLQIYSKACMMYPDLAVYLFHSADMGVWMGCMPEILLKGKGCRYQTMALAGTQPSSSPSWDEKNRKEQRLVEDYIRQTLNPFCETLDVEGPYTVKAGKLAHLRTDFYLTLHRSEDAYGLLQALHPTPAVCGLPKHEAMQFIRTHERHPREYYSGAVGWIDEGEMKLYVNLRCCHMDGKGLLTAFAGGGLLPSSQLEKEWQETSHKLNTVKDVFI